MNHSYDDVNTCFVSGHQYTSVIVMRCPHLEAYMATIRTFTDGEDGTTRVDWEADLDFGPFDSRAELQHRILDAMFIALEHLNGH